LSEQLEIDGSTVLVDGDNIGFGNTPFGTASNMSQLLTLSVASIPLPPVNVSQLVTLSIQPALDQPNNISQLVSLVVVQNSQIYKVLNNPLSLPCFNPCNSFGTYANIIRINANA
jgi:hypothetical protein